MIVTGYFDASGKHLGSKALAISGVLGLSDEWGAFEYEWGQALEEWGLESFHMARFANGWGPFKGWSEATRRERIARLLAIINRHILGSVGVLIPLATYHQYLTGQARKLSGGPYGLAGLTLFREASDLVGPMVPNAEIAYVYEIGDEGHGQFDKIFNDNYRDVAQRAKYRLLSLRFEDKRRYLPLQAADILAYEMYRDFERYIGEVKRNRRYPLQVLWAKPNIWGVLSERDIKLHAEAINLGLEHSTGTWHLDRASTQRARQSRRKSTR